MNVTVRYVQKLWAPVQAHARGEDRVSRAHGQPPPPRGPPTRAERSAVLARPLRPQVRRGSDMGSPQKIRNGRSQGRGACHTAKVRRGGGTQEEASTPKVDTVRAQVRPIPCGIRTTSSWTMAAGSYRTRTTRPASLRGGACSTRATGKHVIEVLEETISKHGKPASILSDRGSQFYATESEKRPRGFQGSRGRLNDLGVRHILAQGGPPPDQRQAGAGARGVAAKAPPVLRHGRAAGHMPRQPAAASRRIPWRGSSNGTTASGHTYRWTRTLGNARNGV